MNVWSKINKISNLCPETFGLMNRRLNEKKNADQEEDVRDIKKDIKNIRQKYKRLQKKLPSSGKPEKIIEGLIDLELDLGILEDILKKTKKKK